VASAGPGLAVTRLLARRAARSGLIWGVVFGATVLSSIIQFTTAYDTPQSRHEIATTIGGNGALRALFGSGRSLETVAGWAAWRSLGIITILGSIWALLAATRWLRGEEDSGRWELLVAGQTTRRGAAAQAVGALGVGLAVLWAATAAVVLASGGVPEAHFAVTASLFLALALVAPAGVFLAVGALASQVAPSRRQASRLAAGIFGVAFLLRVVGNSGTSLHWVQWTTPLGWVQHLHPLTGASVLPLLPLTALIAVLLAATVALAARRDVGAGVLPARDSSPPHLRLLGGPVGLAVRLERSTWLSWAAALAVVSFLFGIVASAVASASSTTLEDALTRLGARHAGVEAYLGIFYLVIGAGLAFAAAGHVAATREEEADGHVDTLLVGPLGRGPWLGGRLAVSTVAVAGLALVAGLGGWLGSSTQAGGVGLGRLLAAGLNTVPAALLVLGVGTLAHAVVPRRAGTIAYAVVAWSFVVEMLGSTGTGGRLLLDLSLFHHVALLPSAPFRASSAAALAGLGAAGMLAGGAVFRRRDLAGA
jgi:ABC-2 type transport system permease protein